jgi:non-heme chloroperoxidase
MRSKLTCISGISSLLLVSILTGCGDDDGTNSTPPDAGSPDASETPAPDAGAPDAGGPMFDKTKKTQELSTGITMTYVEAGNPDGEVVIMLHGYTDTSRSFFNTIEYLVESNTALHIYALDMRGHGGSSMPDGAECPATPEDCFEMTDMADDVLAFMDAKEIQTAHIVGHSQGSLVGQEFALANPERTESLLLSGTFVFGEDLGALVFFLNPLVEGTDASMGQWRGLLEAETPGFNWPEDAYELGPMDADPNAMQFMEEQWVVELTADPAFLAEIVPETTATKLGTWIGALRNFNAFDTQQRLEELTVPTLVIWATQDAFFLFDPDQTRVQAALDGAIEACNLDVYFYKFYGKEPLPASGFQESDIGHNLQFGPAAETFGDDITAWVTTGEPTTDLPYANPADFGTVLVDEGQAEIIEKRKADTCQ